MKAGAKKAGEELKEAGGGLKKGISDLGAKVKKKEDTADERASEAVEEKKGKYEFDDKLKAGAKKVGSELKEAGGDLKEGAVGLGSKLKKKIKD